MDTSTYAKIFTILKEFAPCDPTVVMADGDGAIRAAVSEVFPDALMAMCWFHCKHASKRHTLPYSHYFLFVSGKLKSQFPHIFKEILEDLEQFRNYVIDQEMFNVIWALLERKYEEEYDYPSEVAKSLTLDFLIRYFKKTYVTSKTLNGFWQGFIPQVPLTNNHMER